MALARPHRDYAPLRGISSMATQHALADMAVEFEQRFGTPLMIESTGGTDAAMRVAAGESFDLVILAAGALRKLAGDGHVDPRSEVAIARAGIAVAVAAGAPRPDISSEAALRDAILTARSVGYSAGPSGVYLASLLARWGIGAGGGAPRIVQAKRSVAVGTLIARNEVELGFQQLSELMHVPGVDVVGMLPAEVQLTTVFSGALCAASSRVDEAAVALSFLASPETSSFKRRHGLQPGT